MNSYPVIRYPKSVLSAMPRSKTEPISSQSTPANPSKKITVLKPQYLKNFPWYLSVVLLLVANLAVYQALNLPVLIILGISAFALLIKFAIDHHRWTERYNLAIRRSRVPDHQPPEKKAVSSQIIYPDWGDICDLVTSSLASEAQVGVSESYFLDHLRRYFSSATFGRQFAHPDRQKKYWYSSDIEIVLLGLGLQIEVDEPYAGKNGKPHHCVDHGMDAKRDMFFLDRDWIIIRFAEIQVVSEPIACCFVVAKVVAQLTGDTSYIDLISNSAPPKKVPVWTEKEAKTMAKEDFRHTYLKPAGLWKGS